MKYILYKTTNLVNNKIYIGVHQTSDPYEFDGYLGCGLNLFKSRVINKPKTYFQHAVKKYGWENFRREVLSIYNYEDDAYNAERLVVNEEFLSRSDVYNMVLGGKNGVCNATIKCYQYSKDGKFIQEFKSIQDAANSVGLSPSAIGNAVTYKYPSCGYYWNTDKVDILDLTNYKESQKVIKVYKYKSSTGEFESEYHSITSASEQCHCTLVQVTRSARLGYNVGNYVFSFIKADKYDKANSIYLKTRHVTKYSSSGEFIQEYATQKEAEWDNPNSNITKSIKTKKPDVNGYLWSLETLPKYCSTKTKIKKVGMYDLEGNLLKVYPRVKDWKMDFNITNQYISAEKIYKKKYIFKYIED